MNPHYLLSILLLLSCHGGFSSQKPSAKVNDRYACKPFPLLSIIDATPSSSIDKHNPKIQSPKKIAAPHGTYKKSSVNSPSDGVIPPQPSKKSSISVAKDPVNGFPSGSNKTTKKAAMRPLTESCPIPAHKVIHTLKEALENAYYFHTDLLMARNLLQQKINILLNTSSIAYPSVSADASMQASNGNNLSDQYSSSAGITVQYKLFSGGSDVNAIRAAEETIKAAKCALAKQEQEVFLDVVEAFIEVYKAQKNLEIEILREKDGREVLRISRLQERVGYQKYSDTAYAEAKFSSIQTALESARDKLRTSRAKLQSILSTPLAERLEIPSVMVDVPKSSADVLKEAIQCNPFVLERKHLEAIEVYNAAADNAPFAPEISVYGKKYVTDILSLNSNNNNSNNSVGMQISFPVFNGGKYTSALRLAQQKIISARIETRKQLGILGVKARAFFSQLVTNTKNTKLFESSVKSLKTAYEQAKIEYASGSASMSYFDLSMVEDKHINAETAYLESYLNVILNTYQLMALKGKLTIKDLQLKVTCIDPFSSYQKTNMFSFAKDGKTDSLFPVVTPIDVLPTEDDLSEVSPKSVGKKANSNRVAS